MILAFILSGLIVGGLIGLLIYKFMIDFSLFPSDFKRRKLEKQRRKEHEKLEMMDWVTLNDYRDALNRLNFEFPGTEKYADPDKLIDIKAGGAGGMCFGGPGSYHVINF